MNQHARVEEKPIPFIDVAAQRRRIVEQLLLLRQIPSADVLANAHPSLY